MYQSKFYIRVDEVLIALAYCAKQTHSKELRTLANTEAVTLITDQDDFLLFIHYCAKISAILRGENHLNFGHGMCRMIEKWYGKFSPVDLANMFGEHRSLHGWSHLSVIKKSHFRTRKQIALEAPSPTENSSNSVAQTYNEVASAANNETSTASTSNAPPAQAIVSSVDDDREHVFHFVFCRGSQDYLKYLEDKPVLGPGAQRLKEIQLLKTNENIDSAVQSIRRHKFTLGQMPAHLLEKGKIWEALLPTLSSRTLLKHFNTLKDQGLLNPGSSFTEHFIEVFGNPNTFKSEKICPISLYIHKQLYDENVRYLGSKKAEYYEKKVTKRKITTNPVIKKRLSEMFHQALFNATPASAKFLVVIDLRTGNAKS